MYWIKFFIQWYEKKHRVTWEPQLEAFLAMLAKQRKVSASTHNQALSELLFLYREVLDIELAWLANLNRPPMSAKGPNKG